jgi:hypothetical protein
MNLKYQKFFLGNLKGKTNTTIAVGKYYYFRVKIKENWYKDWVALFFSLW